MNKLKSAEEMREEFKKEFWGKAIDWRATDKDIKQICDFWFNFIAQRDTAIRTEILEATKILDETEIETFDSDYQSYVLGYQKALKEMSELVKSILK